MKRFRCLQFTVTSLYVNGNNEVVIASIINPVSEYAGLLSIHKNEKYYAIWNIFETGEYSNVYYDYSRGTMNRFVSDYIFVYRSNITLFVIILLFTLLFLCFRIVNTSQELFTKLL